MARDNSKENIWSSTCPIYARWIYASMSMSRCTSNYDYRYCCICLTKNHRWITIYGICARSYIWMNIIRCIQWNKLCIFPKTTITYRHYWHTPRDVRLWYGKSCMVWITTYIRLINRTHSNISKKLSLFGKIWHQYSYQIPKTSLVVFVNKMCDFVDYYISHNRQW